MPRIDGPSYRELAPHDDLYGLAAFAYHHADRLPAEVRRGLYVGLAQAWPVTQGDRKDVEHRALMAWTAHGDGASIDAIAEAFAVAPGTARKWVRQTTREMGDAGTGEPPAHAWRVEVVWAEDAAEPPDPAAIESYMRWAARSPSELGRQLDDRRRAREAGARIESGVGTVERLP